MPVYQLVELFGGGFFAFVNKGEEGGQNQSNMNGVLSLTKKKQASVLPHKADSIAHRRICVKDMCSYLL